MQEYGVTMSFDQLTQSVDAMAQVQRDLLAQLKVTEDTANAAVDSAAVSADAAQASALVAESAAEVISTAKVGELEASLADSMDQLKGANKLGFYIPGAVSPTYLKVLSAIINGYPVNDAWFLNETKIAAIRDGTTEYDAYNDLMAMFNCGASKFMVGRGLFKHTGKLITPDGSELVGSGSAKYATEAGGSLLGGKGMITCFESQHTGVGTIALQLGKLAGATCLMVRPGNYKAQQYHFADYTATGNADVGVACGVGSQVQDVTAIAFKESNIDLAQVSKAINCHSYFSKLGYRSIGTDGSVIDCVGMFCTEAGALLLHNYWKTLGGRFEWNARYGHVSGGEAHVIGATADRNGRAGLKRDPGKWGGIYIGNYLSRNGVGGNGVVGRWGFSVPGHPSYLETPADLSAHIEINYEQAVTISGTRFRHGLDDANQGADGPAYNYTSTAASGSTPAAGFSLGQNEGDMGSSVLGYNTAYPAVGASPAATGLQAGGTDTAMKNYLNRGLDRSKVGVESNMYRAANTTSVAVNTLAIKVPKRTGGNAMIGWKNGLVSGCLADVRFTVDAIGTRPTTVITPGVGSVGLTSAVLTIDADPSQYNTLTLTFSATFFVSYALFLLG